MSLIKPVTFEFNNEQYEIRIVQKEDTYHVRAYKNGRPANGYTYQVDLPTAYDMNHALGVSAINELAETAKRDVIEGTWERFVKAYSQSK